MTKTTPRKFVRVTRTIVAFDRPDSVTEHHYIDAVADDGTAWALIPGHFGWEPAPPLPPREE